MTRGNPNQESVTEQIRQLGYEVRVIRNQICIDGEDPMTVKEAREFVVEKKANILREKQELKCGELD